MAEARGLTLLCYDGSDAAKTAIASAGTLLAPAPALVATAWQPAAVALASYTWGPAVLPEGDEIDRKAAESARQTAAEGSDLARKAGFEAEAVAVETVGPLWQGIVDAAAERDAAVIVAGTRGLRGLKSVVLGSVSSGIVHHARRPVLVVPPQE
jgi:nucleotide-binding universal stress UspA family protein